MIVLRLEILARVNRGIFLLVFVVIVCPGATASQAEPPGETPLDTREERVERALSEESIRHRAVLQDLSSDLGELAAASPARYCGTPLAQKVFDMKSLLPPEALRQMSAEYPGLLARPVLELVFDVPDAPFRIHYDTSGINAVRNPTDTADDGVPVYVHTAADALTHAYRLLIDSLGWAPPLSDSAAGGGLHLYDCYLALPGGLAYVISLTQAETAHPKVVGPDTIIVATSYQVVHPTMAPFPQPPDPLDLLRITCAHEFFHAIHFSLDVFEKPSWQRAGWWLEGTATWFEDFAFPDINDWSALPSYTNEPWRSITHSAQLADLHPFGGGSMWTFYLVERFGGPDILRLIWDQCGLIPGDNTLAAISAQLALHSYALDDAWREFAGWCIRTGAQWDDSSFSQGADWPQPRPVRVFSAYPSLLHLTDGQDDLRTLVDPAIPDSTIDSTAVALGSLGFLPISYVPVPTTSGMMRFYVAAELGRPASFFYSHVDTTVTPAIVREVDFPARSETAIPEWSSLGLVTMVAVAGEHYDSGVVPTMVTPVLVAALDSSVLTAASEREEFRPVRFHLGGNYPNPFNSGTTIWYELPVASHVVLDICDILGRRVEVLVDENQPAGVHSVTWSARRPAGTEVASGAYFYRLRTGDYDEIKKMLLIK